MAALRALPIDQAWMTGFVERELEWVMPDLIEATSHETYVVVSDDVVVTPEALAAVMDLAETHPVVTGWCELDKTSPYSNLTRRPFRCAESKAEDYDFFRCAEVRAWPDAAVPTHFAGFALTAMSRELWQQFPYRCSTPTGAADHALSVRLAAAGIPIVGARDGYVRHVKERWGRLDTDPAKRLLIGEVAPTVTVISTQSIYAEVAMTDKVATEDITEVNELGQTVVLVAAGQPIPEGVKVPASKQAPESQAAEIVPDTADADAPEPTPAAKKTPARKSSARKSSAKKRSK